jgi:hypothetical protein
MEASCDIIYAEDIGNKMSWNDRPSNYAGVTVTRWSSNFTVDYVITTTIEVNNISSETKEVVSGNLARAVRRGIEVFEAAMKNHPVLGKAHD